jgi:hypothetical protein
MRKVFSLVLLLVFCKQVHSAQYLEAMCQEMGHGNTTCCEDFLNTCCPQYVYDGCCRDNVGAMVMISATVGTVVALANCCFPQHMDAVGRRISCEEYDEDSSSKKYVAINARVVGGRRVKGAKLSDRQKRRRKQK